MSLVFQEDSKQNSNSQSAEKLFLTTNEDDDMYILTSAAFKASFSKSFLLLFFIFFFIIVVRSSSSRGWCLSLCLLFRRVFTIAAAHSRIGVLRSRNTLKREKKRVSQFSLPLNSLSLKSFPSRQQQQRGLSFFLSLSLLIARANASAVWWLKHSPNRRRNSPNSETLDPL